MTVPADVSQATLDKVAQMKKRVEATIHKRLQDVSDRRMRQIELEQKMREMNLEEDDKRKFRSKYLKEEQMALREQRQKVNVQDFTVVTVIGKGAFGEVRIVREKASKKVFAMKTMRKKDMVAKNQVTHIQAERDLMAAADNTWLVKLFFSFQDDTYLYLVMEYCGGGDLMTILMREDILTEEQTRFYMSELAISINAVHELGFVHRDLKPDNILIANTGHIKLSDFGLAKSFNTSNDSLISKFHKKASTLKDEDAKNLSRATHRNRKTPQEKRKKMYSTVGTPDYIAPEVFSQKGYDKMVDWWSMGVIMFECLVGYPPFYAEDPLQTCRKIVHYRKYFKIPPDANLSREAIDLIHHLVCSHRRRFGFDNIKKHQFFKTCPWHDLQAMKPPFKPDLKSDVDASNFDKIETDQEVVEKYKPSKATDKTHFWGYTFKRPLDMKSVDVQKLFQESGDDPN